MDIQTQCEDLAAKLLAAMKEHFGGKEDATNLERAIALTAIAMAVSTLLQGEEIALEQFIKQLRVLAPHGTPN